jgi:arylsulfatase A-like enzyme
MIGAQFRRSMKAVLIGTMTLMGLPVSGGQPNVLFIALDDLNDWVGCLGGHPQTKTPNIDRLAASGVLFTNAHCPAPACNPSRTAIMTGRSPHRSGMYSNGQKMREVLPDAQLLPKYFSEHGYWSGGSGKMLHYFTDAQSWDEYYPAKETEDPFPPHMNWGKRPKSLPRGGPWQYVETDWHAFDVSDEEFGGDVKVAEWVGDKLRMKQEKPFFLACGIYRPHEPWFVPKKYFDLFPLDEVQLPPGYLEDDLDDLPAAGRKRGPNRYFAHIREQGQWKQGVQAYLASIAFADAMLGRVLDALEAGPNGDNTIVVLWSDHGWHLGEKQHWQKFTGWRASTRVPCIIRVPKGTPGLPEGTKAGGRSSRPVNLLSLYPTLTELAGLPPKADNDGPSLVPLLKDPAAKWGHVSHTWLQSPGSVAVSAEDWRYIKYAGGGEELYEIANDPHEWTNLAPDPKHAAKLREMQAHCPTEVAAFVPPAEDSLPRLPWKVIDGKGAPPSKPVANPFRVVFVNEGKAAVELFWMDAEGGKKSYGEIGAGKRKRQQARPGAVWMVADGKGKPLGYFVVDDRAARAVIPAGKVR